MEEFLTEITEQMLEKRLVKLKSYINEEHRDILKKINDQNEYIANIKKSKTYSVNFQQIEKSFDLFKTACQNILKTYFPLLLDDEFLSLQSENQIMEKITNLKATIERNTNNLIKKINKPKEQIEKEKKIKKDKVKKGKNSKIPLQSTSIMQKWLLENFHDPYPSQAKKMQMARESKLTVYQVNNWFINARQRVIKKFLKKDLKEVSKNRSKSDSDEDSS